MTSSPYFSVRYDFIVFDWLTPPSTNANTLCFCCCCLGTSDTISEDEQVVDDEEEEEEEEEDITCVYSNQKFFFYFIMLQSGFSEWYSHTHSMRVARR